MASQLNDDLRELDWFYKIWTPMRVGILEVDSTISSRHLPSDAEIAEEIHRVSEGIRAKKRYWELKEAGISRKQQVDTLPSVVSPQQENNNNSIIGNENVPVTGNGVDDDDIEVIFDSGPRISRTLNGQSGANAPIPGEEILMPGITPVYLNASVQHVISFPADSTPIAIHHDEVPDNPESIGSPISAVLNVNQEATQDNVENETAAEDVVTRADSPYTIRKWYAEQQAKRAAEKRKRGELDKLRCTLNVADGDQNTHQTSDVEEHNRGKPCFENGSPPNGRYNFRSRTRKPVVNGLYQSNESDFDEVKSNSTKKLKPSKNGLQNRKPTTKPKKGKASRPEKKKLFIKNGLGD